MKKIFLVRHGESEGNIGKFWQTAETPLSARGEEQAKMIADRCSRLPIDVLISSTMKRASQTAEEISRKINKEITYSDLFVEKRRPSILLKHEKDSEESKRINQDIIDNFTKPNFHIDDEENFEDLNERARLALEYLENRPEDNVLVVTHGLFARLMLGRVLFLDKFNATECDNFFRAMVTNNTGISIFEKNKEGQLIVRTWNDHAHLG